MSDTIVVALISLAGTLMGTISGIYVTNKLVLYRIEQLEKAVNESKALQKEFLGLVSEQRLLTQRVDHIDEEQNRIIDDVKEVKRCLHGN